MKQVVSMYDRLWKPSRKPSSSTRIHHGLVFTMGTILPEPRKRSLLRLDKLNAHACDRPDGISNAGVSQSRKYSRTSASVGEEVEYKNEAAASLSCRCHMGNHMESLVWPSLTTWAAKGKTVPREDLSSPCGTHGSDHFYLMSNVMLPGWRSPGSIFTGRSGRGSMDGGAVLAATRAVSDSVHDPVAISLGLLT